MKSARTEAVYLLVALVTVACAETTSPPRSAPPPPSRAAFLQGLPAFEAVLPTTMGSPAASAQFPTYADPIILQLEIHRRIAIASHVQAWYSQYSGNVPGSGILVHGVFNQCYANVLFQWTDAAANKTYQSGPAPCYTIPAGPSPWYDTLLVKGSGLALRRAGVPVDSTRCLEDGPCHKYSGDNLVRATPLAIPIGLRVSTRYINSTGSPVTFTAIGVPDTVGRRAYKVPVTGVSWSWSAAHGGTAQTVVCNPGVNPCITTVKEAGTMTVTATVNGVQQTTATHIEVVPCATGDSLIDKPINRASLADIWSLSLANQPNIDIRRERNALVYDTTYWVSPSGPDDGPCTTTLVHPIPAEYGPVRLRQHVHPFKVTDSLPSACRPKNFPSRSFTRYDNPYGGPSGRDWRVARDDEMPHMVVDKDSIYRIYPHPVDSVLRNGEYAYFPTPNWQSKYKAVPRVFGSCTIL